MQTRSSSQGPSRAASVEEITSESEHRRSLRPVCAMSSPCHRKLTAWRCCHAGDATLWRDLLARAKGDHEQAARWMQQVGAAVPLAATAAADMSGAPCTRSLAVSPPGCKQHEGLAPAHGVQLCQLAITNHQACAVYGMQQQLMQHKLGITHVASCNSLRGCMLRGDVCCRCTARW